MSETSYSWVNKVPVAENPGSLFLMQLSMKISSAISHRGKSDPYPYSMLELIPRRRRFKKFRDEICGNVKNMSVRITVSKRYRYTHQKNV